MDEDFRIEPLGFLRLLRDTSIGGLLTFQRDCSALAISLLISPLSIFYYLRTSLVVIWIFGLIIQ